MSLLEPVFDYEKISKYLFQIEKFKIATFDTDKAKYYRRIVEETIKILAEKLSCENPLFKRLYTREFICTGSMYEGLKIKEPTEFDINLLFRFREIQLIRTDLPNFFEIKVNHDLSRVAPTSSRISSIDDTVFYLNDSNCFKGFPMYSCESYGFSNAIRPQSNIEWRKKRDYPKILFEKELLTPEGVLNRAKLQQWMQSMITMAIDEKFNNQIKTKFPEIREVKYEQIGPAFTLIIKGPDEINVDLVPAIDGSGFLEGIIQPRFDRNRYKDLSYEDKQFVLIPKGSDGRNTTQEGTTFRISFPKAENKLLPDRGCVKLLIRLFKFLRDKNYWSTPSYLIKMMFINELEHDIYLRDCRKEKIGWQFIKMLKKFKGMYETHQLSYYFIPEVNLLNYHFNKENYDNISGQVGNMLKSLSKDPRAILKWFCMETAGYETIRENSDWSEEENQFESQDDLGPNAECLIL